MILCKICGKPLGHHNQPAIRAACHAIPIDPSTVRAAQEKGIDYVRKHNAAKHKASPSRRPFPRPVH